MHPGPLTPTWTQVADLTLGILMVLGGNTSYVSIRTLAVYRTMEPDMVLGRSLGLDDTILGEGHYADVERPQKVQIRRDQLRTLHDFQKLLGDINWLQSTIGLTSQELSNLFQTLQSDKDLNSPRKLSAEAERELALVEKKLQDTHMDHLDPELDCVLVI